MGAREHAAPAGPCLHRSAGRGGEREGTRGKRGGGGGEVGRVLSMHSIATGCKQPLQGKHAATLDWPAADEVPFTHRAHARVLTEYDPAGQLRQAFPGSGAILPAVQATHCEASEAPATEEDPASQNAHRAMPVRAENRPTGQLLHVAPPSSTNFPTAQAVHTDPPAALLVPASHSTHDRHPVVAA